MYLKNKKKKKKLKIYIIKIKFENNIKNYYFLLFERLLIQDGTTWRFDEFGG